MCTGLPTTPASLRTDEAEGAEIWGRGIRCAAPSRARLRCAPLKAKLARKASSAIATSARATCASWMLS
eukprot:4054373-Pleurochrysis_carterae.AAC.3